MGLCFRVCWVMFHVLTEFPSSVNGPLLCIHNKGFEVFPILREQEEEKINKFRLISFRCTNIKCENGAKSLRIIRA